MEPIAGQFVMEFEPMGTVVSTQSPADYSHFDTAADLFARGVALEEHPNTHDEAIAIYLRVLELSRNTLPRISTWARCTTTGRISSPPKSTIALRWNLIPAMRLPISIWATCWTKPSRIADAVTAYRTAIQLAPTYADAHYNLALAFERLRQPRRALRALGAYLKLDNRGPWAVHAQQSNCPHPRRRHAEDRVQTTALARSPAS